MSAFRHSEVLISGGEVEVIYPAMTNDESVRSRNAKAWRHVSKNARSIFYDLPCYESDSLWTSQRMIISPEDLNWQMTIVVSKMDFLLSRVIDRNKTLQLQQIINESCRILLMRTPFLFLKKLIIDSVIRLKGFAYVYIKSLS